MVAKYFLVSKAPEHRSGANMFGRTYRPAST